MSWHFHVLRPINLSTIFVSLCPLLLSSPLSITFPLRTQSVSLGSRPICNSPWSFVTTKVAAPPRKRKRESKFIQEKFQTRIFENAFRLQIEIDAVYLLGRFLFSKSCTVCIRVAIYMSANLAEWTILCAAPQGPHTSNLTQITNERQNTRKWRTKQLA